MPVLLHLDEVKSTLSKVKSENTAESLTRLILSLSPAHRDPIWSFLPAEADPVGQIGVIRQTNTKFRGLPIQITASLKVCRC